MTSEATRTTGARPTCHRDAGRPFRVRGRTTASGAGRSMPAGSGSSSMSSRVGRGSELALDRRFEGWDGVIHGGILCTILDEVMAWALVGEDNWGVTARMAVDFRKPVDGRRADPGGRVDHPGTTSGRRHRRATSSTPRPAIELATATGVYVAARPGRKRDLRERYAYRRREPAPPRQPIRPDRWTPSDDDRPGADRADPTEPPTTTQRGHGPCRRLRRRAPRRGRGPRHRPGRVHATTLTASRPP